MESGVTAEQQPVEQTIGGASPISAELVLGATPVLKEPQLLNRHLFWLEQRPAERGRTTLMLRDPQGCERELTPELDLRSRIHGYGGGVYCLAARSGGGMAVGGMTACIRAADATAEGETAVGSTTAGSASATPASTGRAAAADPLPEWGRGAEPMPPITAVVVADGGRSLWRLDLDAGPSGAGSAAAAGTPRRLTPEPEHEERDHEPPLFADGLIDPARDRWIGVLEQDGRDRLVAVPLSGGAAHLLWDSPDFCGYAALSPSGSHLAWLSWRQPCMPWERSQLWLGRFDDRGELSEVRAIGGSDPSDATAISLFQPLWAGPDLVVSNDRSGWWNLELLPDAEQLAADAQPGWRPLLPMQAEFGMPQWVYGMRTSAWDGQRLLAAACQDGRWQLGALVPEGEAAGEAVAPSATGTAPVAAAAGSAISIPADGQGLPPELQASSDRADNANTNEVRPQQLPMGEGLTAVASTGASPATAPAGTAAPGAGFISRTPVNPDASGLAHRPARLPSGAMRWQPIPLPFDDLAGLAAEDGCLVAIASGPLAGPGLLELNLQERSGQPLGLAALPQADCAPAPSATQAHWSHHPAAPAHLTAERISRPEPLWFAGHGGRPTHAWYYPPQGGASARSPLLLKGHSGPTAMARTGLNLAMQYWTSRGWGVLDVNYGGSTGFGRAYRERLDGGWGVVDVDDCLAAAQALVDSGRADPSRIAMEGSSASGFTVLAALAGGDTIRAGAVRYPVTDLTALAEGDHRFEARYFDALVGPWPAARELYEQRSPLNQVEQINAPLLFFHGLDDAVVPAQQSIALVERLQARGVPVELVLFEGEGHGFRAAAVQRQVLERTEAFFRERLQLP